ncbi:unnamed protein product [Colias eurytheme]|nr:unnamed protein product [Colias eurytheme]
MKERNYITIIVMVFVPYVCFACFTDNQEYEYRLKTGSTFYMECRCEQPTSSRIMLQWLDTHDQTIEPSGPGTKSNVYTEWWDEVTYSLYITNISKSISGNYKCVTDYNGQIHYHTYDVEAYDPPYFVNTKEAQYVVSGSDALINCEARGETDPLITWHKDGSEPIEITDDSKYEISGLGLLIRNITDEDTGVYKCTANDFETGEEVNIDIKVEVITKPEIEEVTAIPDNVAYEGASIAMDCSAHGIPPPEYTWKKVSKNDNGSKTNYEQVFNRIVFENITASDRGIYECIASNSAGSVSKQIELKVLVPPTITQFSNVTAIEDGTIQIVCKAKGIPIPKINILFLNEETDDHSIVWDSKKISDTEIEFYLSFLRVNRQHEGSYICNATNEVESVTSEMHMSVLYKPYFSKPTVNVWGWDSNPVNLTCDYESNPPSNITWRYQGSNISTNVQLEINRRIIENENKVPVDFNNETMYGIYECTAINDYGEAKKIIVFLEGFPPPPIRNVTVQNVTSTSVTFSIEGPEEIPGPNVIGFTSEYDLAENYNITNIHVNRTWAVGNLYRINKLKPNSSYLIKFAAVNDVGAGAWSDSVEFNTLEKSTPEEPIWETDLDSINEGILKWRKSDDTDEQIEFYYIRYCPVLDLVVQYELCNLEIIEPTTQFDLNKLESNTTYYFELVAHNSLGNSTVASNYITSPVKEPSTLSAAAILGIVVVIVFLVLLLLDFILLLWRKQGIIASCVNKKKKDKKVDKLDERDKKGLLRDNAESTEVKRPANGHKEYEYNKTTGVITGKHSAV